MIGKIRRAAGVRDASLSGVVQVFKGDQWKAWLAKIRPSYRFPKPDAIGGRLLNNEYIVVQKEAIRVIGTFKNICMTLEGVMNKAGNRSLT